MIVVGVKYLFFYFVLLNSLNRVQKYRTEVQNVHINKESVSTFRLVYFSLFSYFSVRRKYQCLHSLIHSLKLGSISLSYYRSMDLYDSRLWWCTYQIRKETEVEIGMRSFRIRMLKCLSINVFCSDTLTS